MEDRDAPIHLVDPAGRQLFPHGKELVQVGLRILLDQRLPQHLLPFQVLRVGAGLRASLVILPCPQQLRPVVLVVVKKLGEPLGQSPAFPVHRLRILPDVGPQGSIILKFHMLTELVPDPPLEYIAGIRMLRGIPFPDLGSGVGLGEPVVDEGMEHLEIPAGQHSLRIGLPGEIIKEVQLQPAITGLPTTVHSVSNGSFFLVAFENMAWARASRMSLQCILSYPIIFHSGF